MKKLLITTLLAASFLVPAQLEAKAKAKARSKAVATKVVPAPAATPIAATNAHPALWVVKDEDTTIYLFGTVHLLPKNINWFDGKIKSSFDGAQEAVFEVIDGDDPETQQTMMGAMRAKDGPNLSEKLEPADRAAYQKAMEAAQIPWQAFEQMKPWAVMTVATLMPLTKEGIDPKSGADKILTDKAKVQKKQLTGLETVKIQLGYFDSIDEKLQIKMLNETVKDLADGRKKFDQMVGFWAQGNPEELGKLMNTGTTADETVRKILLTDRNSRWAEWIDTRMKKPGTVFIAVGAGHLAGTDSVQDYLAKRNLKAERIK